MREEKKKEKETLGHVCGQDERERGKKRTVGDRAEEEERCDGGGGVNGGGERKRESEEREKWRDLMRAVWQFCRGH